MRNYTTTALLFVASTLVASSAHAGWYTGGTWDHAPDEGLVEQLVFTVKNWSGTGLHDLNGCTQSGKKLQKQFRKAGYTNRIRGTNGNAWASSWTQDDREDLYVDSADHAFVCTHGGSGHIAFNDNEVGSMVYVWYSDVYWGDVDVETIAFQSCSLIDDAGRTNYRNQLIHSGIHYLLAFRSMGTDNRRLGHYYGYYARRGYKLRTAWRKATKRTHDSSREGAYLRFTSVPCNTANDTATYSSCDPVVNASARYSSWTL